MIKETLVVWFKAARAPFLVVSFIPAILGGLIAWYRGGLDPVLFGVVMLGVVMAHSAADFIDDYFDFKKGNLGNKEKQFHDSPLIDGKVTPGQVMLAALLCLAIAAAAGVYAFLVAGMPVLYLMAAGGFIVFFYTSPPFKLNYRGLGETALFLGFGPLIVFGVYFVLRPQLLWEPILLGAVLGIFTMNIGIVSNTFDHDDDVRSGKRTLALRLGQANAVRFLAAGSVAADAVLVTAVLAGLTTPWSLLALAAAPLAVATVRKTSLYADTANYTGAMTSAIALSSASGILLCAGYGIAIALR